jgi:hypothetical protein
VSAIAGLCCTPLGFTIAIMSLGGLVVGRRIRLPTR